MFSPLKLCVVLAVVALGTQLTNVQAVAPAPAPGTVLESDAAAAEAYPISTQEALPLTDSATLPVTCNITLIGLPASSTAAVSAAGRRLQAATNTSRGLETADINCVGSYNVTIVGGPALETFASGWTGKQPAYFSGTGQLAVRMYRLNRAREGGKGDGLLLAVLLLVLVVVGVL